MNAIDDLSRGMSELELAVGGQFESLLERVSTDKELFWLAQFVYLEAERIERRRRGRGFFRIGPKSVSGVEVVHRYLGHFRPYLRGIELFVVAEERTSGEIQVNDLLHFLFPSEDDSETPSSWKVLDNPRVLPTHIVDPFVEVDLAVREFRGNSDDSKSADQVEEAWQTIADIIGIPELVKVDSNGKATFIGSEMFSRYLETPIAWCPEHLQRRVGAKLREIQSAYEQAARSFILGLYEATVILCRTALEKTLIAGYELQVPKDKEKEKFVWLATTAEARFERTRKWSLGENFKRANRVVHGFVPIQSAAAQNFLAIVQGVIEEAPE